MIPSTVVLIRRNTCEVLCNLLKYGRKAKWKRHHLFLPVILVIFAFYYYGLFSKEVPFKPVTRNNLQQYCNFPVNANGMEGKIPSENRDFKLEMVHILIRHGDRSPIYRLEGFNKKRKLDCSMTSSDKTVKKKIDTYLKSLKYINTRKLSSDASEHQLTPISSNCEYSGQLTQRGFQQLIEIGHYLSKAYCRDLEVTSSKHIYARSTNYDRTAQTVAAMLSGFLGEKIDNIGPISINVTKDTFFSEDDNGVMKSCPGSKKPVMESKMTAEYRKGMDAMEPFMQEISDLLLMTRQSLPTISFITDYSLAYFCHGFQPPCARNGCFSESTALKMLSYSDWYFNAKYKQFSDMLSLPVLSHIGSRMLSKIKSQSPINFAIYGGHESSIIPVLQSLGTYNRRWIPYASRLVFELWSKSTNSQDALAGKFIRVLFNGELVTKKLEFCKWKVVHNGEFCPLSVFLEWIGGGQFENASKRYDKLCKG